MLKITYKMSVFTTDNHLAAVRKNLLEIQRNKAMFCILLCLIFLSASFATNDELILLHAVWRHGDRTPIHLIPDDVNNTASTWPQGLGELSTIGMRQEFDLGRVIQHRYSTGGAVYSLISQNYTQPQIYVRSDDYNRTLMSAMANLAGLFSNSTSDVHVDGWPAPFWQPIPVHTIALDTDNLINVGVPCPKADQIYADVVMTQENYTSTAKSYEWLYRYLDPVCGFTAKITFSDMSNIHDPLKCELNHREDGHSWPNFINGSIYDSIKDARNSWDQFQFSNPQIARLRGGNLLGDIVKRMQQKRSSLDDSNNGALNWVRNLKYYMYSAHDDTLDALLNTLGAAVYAGPGYPDYSACALFELWKNDTDYYMKAYYRINSTYDFEPMQIDGCPNDKTFVCTLDQFYNRSYNYIPVNWYQECQIVINSAKTATDLEKAASEPLLAQTNF